MRTLYTDIYNENIKMDYLNTIEDVGTKENIKRLFAKSSELESYFKKDLYDFNYDQYSYLWIWLAGNSIENLKKEKSIVKSYNMWAIGSTLKTSQIEVTDLFTEDDLRKHLKSSARHRMINSREELYELCNMLVNKQDAGLLVCFYEGLTMDEIINLKKVGDCINFEKQTISTHTPNKPNEDRYITDIPAESFEILKQASEERIYQWKNGKAEGKTKSSRLNNDNSTEYLFASLKRNEKDNLGDPVDENFVNSKFQRIKKFIHKNSLTIKTLIRSGFCERCWILEQQKGQLEQKDFKEMCGRFKLDVQGSKTNYVKYYSDWKKETNK